MTDNGMAGSVGVQNGQKFNSFNCGMKGAKATVHEGGTRVPSFWHWKGPYLLLVGCDDVNFLRGCECNFFFVLEQYKGTYL